MSGYDSRLQQAIQQAAPAVRFNAVDKVYDNGVHALKGIQLDIHSGEIFGIIGRSGAGKSSLLRTINRLEQPSNGQVLIAGADIAPYDENRLVALRRNIGMIFQHFNLMSAKTVQQNIELPLKVAGVARDARRRKVAELIHLVGLEGREQAYPAQLSGGQKQRVGIARALVHDPHILLCDEATSALDPETTQSILALLRSINRQLNLTIVLITHEMSVIREVCDRVAVIERGELVETGPVWQVFGEPQHEVTRTLLSSLRQALPDDLAARLQAQPGEHENTLLLHVQFSGNGVTGLDLNELATALNASVRLIDGSVERIQGRSLGRLLLAVGQSPLPETALLAEARRFTDHAEVLGYVAAA